MNSINVRSTGLPEEVIVLFEVVIRSNRALIEQNQVVQDNFEATEERNRDTFKQISETLRDLTNTPRETGGARRSARRSASQDKIIVPTSCRRAVRKVYKALSKKDDFHGFYYDESVDSENNSGIFERVLNGVLHDNGGERCNWTRAVMEAAFKRFFLSRSETSKMINKETYDAHKRRSRKNGRKRKKLTRRTLALDQSQWQTSKKGKVADMLTQEAMGSEESDYDEDSGKVVGYKVKRLSWESGKTKKYKKQLEKIYFNSLSKRARDRVLKRVDGDPNTKECPPNLPAWAVKN